MARTYKDAANAWQLPLHSFFVFLRSNIIILLFFTICWILDREHLKKESTGSWLPAKALRAQTHIIDSPISSLSLSLIWVWRVNDYEFVLAGSHSVSSYFFFNQGPILSLLYLLHDGPWLRRNWAYTLWDSSHSMNASMPPLSVTSLNKYFWVAA